MPFDWRFRNFKRDPQPFLNGAVIDEENARNNLIQNAGNSMEGYTPLESTLAAQAMEGYNPVIPATQSQLAAGASQAMQGYTPNSVGRPSVPNDMHGGMGQPDLEGYGESLQAASDNAAAQAQAEQEAAQKQAQIDSIKARISELESHIAANQAKLNNWHGVGGQIAALEARKINSQDPTSIWRWKQDKDYAAQLAAKQNGAENTAKTNAMIEIANDLDSIIVDDTITSQDKKAYLSKLSNMKTLGEKASVPKSVIDSINAKIAEVKGETKQLTQEKPESVTEEDFDFEGGPRDIGEARATKILQKDPEKLTQNELATLKRDIMSGKISVSNETKNKIDKIYSQIIDRDKKKNESIKKAKGLVGKKNLTSKEIEFMSGMKGFKKKSDEYGNVWFDEVL